MAGAAAKRTQQAPTAPERHRGAGVVGPEREIAADPARSPPIAICAPLANFVAMAAVACADRSITNCVGTAGATGAAALSALK
jgi:hypothetical protein